MAKSWAHGSLTWLNFYNRLIKSTAHVFFFSKQLMLVKLVGDMTLQKVDVWGNEVGVWGWVSRRVSATTLVGIHVPVLPSGDTRTTLIFKSTQELISDNWAKPMLHGCLRLIYKLGLVFGPSLNCAENSKSTKTINPIE